MTDNLNTKGIIKLIELNNTDSEIKKHIQRI